MLKNLRLFGRIRRRAEELKKAGADEGTIRATIIGEEKALQENKADWGKILQLIFEFLMALFAGDDDA